MTNKTDTQSRIYRQFTGWYDYQQKQVCCLVERGGLDEHLRFQITSWRRYRLTPASARRIAALRIVAGCPY